MEKQEDKTPYQVPQALETHTEKTSPHNIKF